MDRILVWNVRGINNSYKHREITSLITSKQAGLVSLLETKIKNKDMGNVYLKLFSGWCFTNNNSWIDKGRILLAWNPGVFQVNIINCTSQLIHCEVTKVQTKEQFQITFVYGVNEEAGRRILWTDLRKIAATKQGPWLVIGDFNDILHMEERVGKRRTRKINGEFVECVAECGLEDLKYTGCFYT